MKCATISFIVLCFAITGYAQSYDQCQQQCTNIYNLCTSNADQQLSQCLAAVQAGELQCVSCTNRNPGQECQTCSAPNGCPTGQPSCRSEDCCHSNASWQTSQCNSTHDAAIATCSQNYSDCSNNCANLIFPPGGGNNGGANLISVSDPILVVLMRNLSRPEKLKLTL